MNQVALDLDEDVAGTMYGYQIVEDDEGFRIWVSTGAIKGRYIGGTFAEFTHAFSWLANFIAGGEPL